ncbi:transglycosylase domain-containing protein [Streptacidiphilus sp. MAP12-16]|uniref:transglycosylase domain-containing protein n=1 Tax=Streptacidiphilus sp. MAP12-16 TaxID=3156300 RepID=UPI0035171A6A
MVGERLRAVLRIPGRLFAPVRASYPRPGRTGFRRWMPAWHQVLALVLMIGIGLIWLVGIAYLETGIPTDLNAFATQQDNIYYWADGTEMARTGQVDRQVAPLSEIPVPVQWAVLAAENETFYTDDGVSPNGIVRAAYLMATGGSTQGGSTITQQYVKNVYLNQKQTLTRKATEIFISVKLDNKLSKQQILDGYLNTSWFGRGAYGIERAAKVYYGVDVSQLTPSQGAFLATLLKGAGLYDPAISPANHQRAVTRWNWILDRMVKIGRLSAAERATYTTFPEPIQPPRASGLNGETGYLVDLARANVSARTEISDQQFDLGGYQIYTTFQKPSVAALADAVQRTTAGLNPAARPADRNVSVGAASVATDGRILALYGGPDYLKQGFDNANTSTVPAGSAFTPFVYAAALGQGVQTDRGGPRVPVTPATRYNGDNKVVVHTPEGPYWNRDGQIVRGINDGGRSFGQISLRSALEQSVNSPFVQLGMDVGLDRVRSTAVAAGLLPVSMGAPVPYFSLGNSMPSAIRMADGYGTFAAAGVHTDPYSVLRVTRAGAAVPVDPPVTKQALSADVANQVDAALVGAVNRGDARGAKLAGRRVGGKTGTMLDNTVGWFVGYTGKTVTAVNIFHVDPKNGQLLSLEGLGGAAKSVPESTDPMRIWTAYTRATTG